MTALSRVAELEGSVVELEGHVFELQADAAASAEMNASAEWVQVCEIFMLC